MMACERKAEFSKKWDNVEGCILFSHVVQKRENGFGLIPVYVDRDGLLPVSMR